MKFKYAWKRIRDRVFYAASEMGYEVIRREYIIRIAEEELGFKIEKPHLLKMVDGMLKEINHVFG